MNPTSLEEWYPCILSDVPQPETIIIPFSHKDCIRLLSPEYWTVGKKIRAIHQAAVDVGYPCFMRTAYYSAKFDGVCIVRTQDDLFNNLVKLVASSFEEEKPVEAICIRKFIKSNGTEKLMNGLPVGSERRYFIIEDVIYKGMPYWNNMSVNDGTYIIPTYYLNAINTITQEEEDLLNKYTDNVRLCMKLPRLDTVDWSVDYMKDINGKWWLIDMGEAYKSWMPEPTIERL